MAVDEAILESVASGNSLPTLRLYAWDPPCLSLGLAQPAGDVDMEVLRLCGWEIVRRPTGGRAILHADELTYSIMAQPSDPLVRGSLMESYHRIANALLFALEQLALTPRADRSYNLPAGTDPRAPVCFERPSNFEIMVNGKKIIGSAQSRRMNGILQHGSLPLFGDIARITDVLRYPDEPARAEGRQRLTDHATTVHAVLGQMVSWQEAASAFAAAFTQVAGLDLQTQELSPAEIARAKELVTRKYSHPTWTMRY